jgi:uncharacterized Zn-binding protein involved in type VI secretion
MPAAARLQDPIEHSNALTGLLVGAAIGVAFGVFVVATGGAGAVVGAAIIGGAMASGAGIGEVMGSLSISGGTVTGGIASGSPDTTVNSLRSTRATDDTVLCSGTPPIYLPAHMGKHVAQGSDTVTINSQPASRVGDKIECGSKIKSGSPNVIIGGATAQTMDIDSEVPGYIHATLLVVGIASAVVLAGPVVAVVGTLGSIGGGAVGQWGAAKLGLNEDWQKIFGLVGSFAGGYAGSRGGAGINRGLARTPGENFLQVNARRQVAREFYAKNGSTYDPTIKGMRPMKPAEINSAMRGIDFNKPVEVVEPPPRLGSYQAPGGRQGNYYADTKHTPNELGIGDYANSPGGPVPKENWQYDINPGTKALRSSSGAIDDTWSAGVPQTTDGGGIQYYIPDKSAANLVPGSGTPLSAGQLNPRGPIPGAGPLATSAGPPPVTGSPPVQQPLLRPLLESPQLTGQSGAGQAVINDEGIPKP